MAPGPLQDSRNGRVARRRRGIDVGRFTPLAALYDFQPGATDRQLPADEIEFPPTLLALADKVLE